MSVHLSDVVIQSLAAKYTPAEKGYPRVESRLCTSCSASRSEFSQKSEQVAENTRSVGMRSGKKKLTEQGDRKCVAGNAVRG